MVMIHLAKITLLEKSCDYFKKVIIPKKVYEEITFNKEKYAEVKVIKELIEKDKIVIKQVKDLQLIKKANEFNILKGEAEAVALYWQEKADYLATDDDNVRKKREILNLKMIGTPVIIFKLYKEKMIEKEKFVESITKLRKIGWFSNAVIDKILMEEK